MARDGSREQRPKTVTNDAHERKERSQKKNLQGDISPGCVTNCGRKAKKKSAVFGFRILTIMPCPKTRLSLTRGASWERSRDPSRRSFCNAQIDQICRAKIL